ncbi:MAG: glycosyl hydrolase 108 family protein [Reyranella sp.]|uniref:glycoside hydrolase family 108 protein n=1 Tax=Reyranella sp. TaxID=1929291 RepID=UPI00272FDABF|nr:glycosyl hydrolase 108 family protein [Reyranella sp.]MDP1964004.1 glycosyl hydrolase 108 family protein [Reyranella sp.]MDP2376549.1 glycosyl hydrolase 108 family protein [Reyranella sp.]
MTPTPAPYPFPPKPAGFTPDDQARWEQVSARILRIEGGWSDDKADNGGATKYGISLRFAVAAGDIDVNGDGLADLDLNMDGVIDGHDIRLLTPPIALALYFGHFWIDPGIWKLPRPIDAAVFDQAVNGGTTAAIRLLQRACNRVGGQLVEDGRLGPRTRAGVALAVRGGKLLAAYRACAAERYREIARRDPSQNRFLKGWLNRASELGRV